MTVDLKLHLTEETLAWVLAIADKVLAGCGCLVDDGSVEVDVLVGVLGVGTRASANSDSGGRLGGSGVLIEATYISWECGDAARGGDVASNSVECSMDNHIMEEITELGDAELNRASKLRCSGIRTSLIISSTVMPLFCITHSYYTMNISRCGIDYILSIVTKAVQCRLPFSR